MCGACGSNITGAIGQAGEPVDDAEIDSDSLSDVSTAPSVDVVEDVATPGPIDLDGVGDGQAPSDVDTEPADDADVVEPGGPVGVGSVTLNEFLARNDKGITDVDGKTSDWVELYNPGDGPMAMAGWALTDDVEDPQQWVFPDVSIPAGGYLVVFASGKDRREPAGELHTNFKLSGGGDSLALTDPDGVIVQDLGQPYPFQLDDISTGTHIWPGVYYLDPPTPGEANSTSTAALGLGDVSFSPSGGLFTEPFELTLSGPSVAQLRVTLDGSEPDESSLPYTGPITVTTTTQVRVAVVDEDEDLRYASQAYVLAEAEVADFVSDIPVLVIESAGFDIDSEADLEERPFRPLSMVVVEDATAGLASHASWAGSAAMHVRGSSSSQYAKKQYTLEMRDERDKDLDVPLLGMPADSDWVLHAPYSDKSLMRNAMIYQWSNSIDRYAVRTRFVEVFITAHGGAATAGDYHGVYVLMEKIKRGPSRVDIAKLDKDDIYEPQITGGYLLKKDWWAEGFDTLIYQDHLIWVEPEADELEEEQKAWLSGFFNAFESALAGPDFTNPWMGYAAFIDVDSFIDHHLLVEFARNVDGFVLSTYLHKDREGRLNMGPIWDYNGALGGADYFCSWQTEGWHHTFNEAQCGGGGQTFPADNPNAYAWYERLFEQRYAQRWEKHRKGALATAQIHAAVDAAAASLSQAQQRNFDRWPVLGEYVWPNAPGWDQRVTFELEVAYLKSWLADRAAWMDQVLALFP
jgi:hypothetical protein